MLTDAITECTNTAKTVSGNKVSYAGMRLRKLKPPLIHGLHQSIIKFCIWLTVFSIAFFQNKNPFKAFILFKKLKALRADFRGNQSAMKYSKAHGKYYFTFNAPGFPSKAFNKYVLNNLGKITGNNTDVSLNTIIFGITKKCGYQCEHCFEWDSLNKPETLSKENLLSIIQTFQQFGITQVHLSGGEPLNRFDDIVYLLQHITGNTEVWLYTSGYQFTQSRAAILRNKGLCGVTISLDHWIPELHNNFRGRKNAFEWVEKAVGNARQCNLVVSLSLCATNEFITKNNLTQYAELAKQWGVSFIQILEPRAVGHYAGKTVSIRGEKIKLLEDFFLQYNYDRKFKSYPLIVYHGFYSRRVSCGGGGKHYVYVDTDGDVHNCPFCQQKLFSALNDDVEQNLQNMQANSCTVFHNTSIKTP